MLNFEKIVHMVIRKNQVENLNPGNAEELDNHSDSI